MENSIDKQLDEDINNLLFNAGFKIVYNEQGYKTKQSQVGSLWEKKCKTGIYYSGKIYGKPVVVFLTRCKPPKPQAIVCQCGKIDKKDKSNSII